MRNFNLVLAVFWLLLAVALLTWTWVAGDSDWRIPLGNSSVAGGWLALLALLLAFYNLVRWWSSWSYAKQQRELREAEARRRDAERATRRASESAVERDPNFIFTEQPERPRDEKPAGP